MTVDQYEKLTEIVNWVSNTMYIGIDPGKNGGIACMFQGQITAHRCPSKPQLMARLFEDIIKNNMCRVMIEKVHSFPGQGVVSMFSFGQNFGQWEGIISSFSVYFSYVEPKKWQKHYRIKEKNKKIRKLKFKNLAQAIAPDLKMTYAISDAVLIANYGLELANEI